MFGFPIFGQEGDGRLTTRNPLDDIVDELREVLVDSGVPFSPVQEDEIVLVLEESRLASEQLFGASICRRRSLWDRARQAGRT